MRLPSRSLNRARSPLTAIAAWLSLASSSGCTDPVFRDLPSCDGAVCEADAGDLDSTAGDGDVDAESEETIVRPDGPTSWAEDMVGLYGIRIRFYSLSTADGSPYEHEIIMLARITDDTGTGRVSMTAQRCKDDGRTISRSLIGAQQTFSWPGAANLPEEHFELVREGELFHTVAAPRAIGYVEKQPEGCVTGNTLAARPGQVWQQTCTCRNDPLPMTTDDCRITDADGDGNPGVSTLHGGIVHGTNFVRVQDRCRIINGMIAKDGKHTAKYVEDYDYKELQCGGSTCPQIPVRGCLPEFNPVEFQPLEHQRPPSGGEWDCASLVAGSASGALFSSANLRFPDACHPP